MNTPLALTLPLAILLLVLATTALLTALGGRSRTLRRGGRLGLRTPAANASDEAFATGNAAAAPVFLGAAVIGLVDALVVLFLPVPVAAIVIVGVMGLAGMVAMAYIGTTLGERVARTVPLPARKPEGGGGCGGCACGTGGRCGGLTRSQESQADPLSAQG